MRPFFVWHCRSISVLSISLCLHLLSQWLFCSALILNDTSLRICIYFKKTHWNKRFVFAYNFSKGKYFQLANACHCNMFVWCFSYVKSFWNRIAVYLKRAVYDRQKLSDSVAVLLSRGSIKFHACGLLSISSLSS